LTLKDGYISAQLDNVVSVAVLIHLFRKGFQGTALFTAEEESGKSWRYALSWFQRQQKTTQRLLVLDTSPYPTTEAASAQDVVLRRKDLGGEFSPFMTEELEGICRELRVSHSYKDEYVERMNATRTKPLSLGRTELGRLIAATDGQITGTTLQIPTTGYHTTSETASLRSVAAVLRLLETYLPR
jgi:putative aminopeptidase FrvX